MKLQQAAIIYFFLIVCVATNAQVKDLLINRNENDIAKKIADKAKLLNLGAVHSESATMRPTAGKGGYFLRYEKGWVYYNPNTKTANGIWGDIMNKWSEMGYETGELGFPASDEKDSDKPGWKRMNNFDNGVIYWNNGKIEVVKKSNAGNLAKNVLNTNTLSVSPALLGLKKLLGNNFNLERRTGSIVKSITTTKGTRPFKKAQSGNSSCVTEYKTLDIQNPDQDVLSAAAIENISLGAIYNIADFKTGNFNNIGESEGNRNALRLSISNHNANKLVETPTFDNLKMAYDVLLNEKANVQPRIRQILKSTEIYSKQDLNIQAAVSYWGGGINLDDEFKMSQSSTNHKYLLDFYRESFVVTARPTITGKFFKDDALNQKSDLVYVDKLLFGARLLVYFEKSDDILNIENELKGDYANISVETKQKYQSLLSATVFKIFSYGLPASLNIPKSAIGFDALMTIVNTSLASFDKQQNYFLNFGQPISYSLRFLNGDVAVCTGKMENLPQTTCTTENWKWKVEFMGLYCEKTDDSPADGDEINGWIDITAWGGDGQKIEDRLNRKGDRGFNATIKFKPTTKNQIINHDQLFDFATGDDNAYIQIRSRIWDEETTKNDYSSSNDASATLRKFYLRDIKIKTPEADAMYGAIPALELHPGYGKYYLLVKLTPVNN